MSTTYMEIERLAGNLHAQIELEVTGRVVPASRTEYNRYGDPVQPAEPASVEDIDVEPIRAVVSLADKDREVWRGETDRPGASRRGRQKAVELLCAALARDGFSLALTDEEKARAEELLCEAAEAEREPDPDRWRDERADRECEGRRTA